MERATVQEAEQRIVLVDAPTEAERRRAAEELGAESGRHGGAVVVPLDGTVPVDDADPSTVVTAARVAWLPPPGPEVRRGSWSSAIGAFTQLRRPPAPLRGRALRTNPGRARLVVAEPATIAELRDRWRGQGRFAEFVARQAALALDRAERAVVGDRVKVPRHVVEAVESSVEFDREVRDLAASLDRPNGEVRTEAIADLHGLVAAMDPMAVEAFTGIFRPLHARAWAVDVNTAGLARLRELNQRAALVFLPSHRSYVDPLVLADVLAAHDFPRNHVLGGENLSFWPLSGLAKRAGIVFIRRNFGEDRVYKLAVREYLAFLLAKRFNLEWYMEGGRSRTGKLRPPRYGILGYVADGIVRRRADDAYLVPVSITYDQLGEASGMAAEQRGVAKKGEGLPWLASYARAQRRPMGTAHVRFAEPLSLREAIAGTDPADADAWRLTLQKVAFEVAVRINRVTPATATALVTLALLGVRDRALTLGQVRAVVEPVRQYFEARDLPYSADALCTAGGLRRVLDELARNGVVTVYEGGEEPVYSIEPGQHLVAAFYRNTAIHHFVDRAIAELVLLADPADRWEEAMRLRDLLKFEFFFPEREEYRAQLAAELDRLHPEWETVEDGREVLCTVPLLAAHRVLRSFVDAQLVVAERLAGRSPRTPIVERDFLAECTGVGRQMLLQGRLHGPESLSRELFTSALKLAANLDLVDPGREELAERRRAFAAQLRDVVARVVTIDHLDAESRREAIGVEP